MELNNLSKALITELDKEKPQLLSGEPIKVSRTISAVALLYEKVRTAIEYREDHLLRRAAIERILKRRFMLNANGRNIAEPLLKELLWAKYLPEDTVSTLYITKTQKIIDKYVFIRNEISRGRPHGQQSQIAEWLVSTCAAEIEEVLSPHPERDAFIHYIYQYFKDRTEIKDESDRTRDIQVYIAVHRAYAKSDNDYIRYEIIKLTFPNYVSMEWSDIKPHLKEYYDALLKIQQYLSYPLSGKMVKKLSPEVVPFRVLRDIYEENPLEYKNILSEQPKFKETVDRTCRIKYDEIGRKLKRAAVRSIIYVFLTKMLIVLFLEYPLTKFLGEQIHYLPLGINVFFPAILMAISLIGVSSPGQDNTDRIIVRLNDILYSSSSLGIRIQVSKPGKIRNPILWFIFTVLYISTFILVFGAIYYILTLLFFSIFSIFIFMFFVSVILFFAYRVRSIRKDYLLSERESFFEPILSFILLPILNVGKILSSEIAKINFLVAVFDFIIEAPFKAIFEIFEEWFSFMRQKKEDIL
jgi:hypothetical protein